jgi:hypothetical protein
MLGPLQPLERLPEGGVKLSKSGETIVELRANLVEAKKTVNHGVFIPGSTMDTHRMQREGIARIEEELKQLVESETKRAVHYAKCVDAIVARCSRHSGWTLQWEWTKHGSIRIWDPKTSDPALYDQSKCPSSTLVLDLYDGQNICLREVYGRMRNWAIDHLEQAVIAEAIVIRRDMGVS